MPFSHLLPTDVAHAFIHSPMPPGEHVALRLPLSVSFEDGQPVFMYPFRSLNGLRHASMHWLSLLSRTIRKLGLWADETEPCIYGGCVKGLGHALLVAYVDDVLLASENEKVQEAVEEAIGKVVPVKCTGSILAGDKFLRRRNSDFHRTKDFQVTRSFAGYFECE